MPKSQSFFDPKTGKKRKAEKPKKKDGSVKGAFKALKMIFSSPSAAQGPSGVAAEKLKKELQKAGIQK